MSRRILIVDDEDDIREVAQMSLEMVAGWEVFAARDGEEGCAWPPSTAPTPSCWT